MDPTQDTKINDPGSSSSPVQIDPAALTQGQPVPPGGPTELVEMAGPSALSTSEAATMDRWLKEDLAAGKMTQADYDAARKEAGLDALGKPDTRTPAQVEFDRVNPAGKPEEFLFPYDPRVTLTAEQRGFDAQARAALADAGWIKEAGSTLAKEIARSAKEHAAMTPEQTHLQKAKAEAQLRQLWGNDFEKNMDMAKQLYKELGAKHPKVAAALEGSLALNSAKVVVAFFNQAVARKERDGK